MPARVDKRSSVKEEDNVAQVSDPSLNDDTSGPTTAEEQVKRGSGASKEKLQASIDADDKIEVQLRCEREASKEETDKTVEDGKLETNVGAEKLSGA